MLVFVEPAIKAKRRNELRSKKVMFHQDNARSHVSASTTKFCMHSNAIICLTHHVIPTSFPQTSTFFHICSNILLVLFSTQHRTSEMKFICFWTRGQFMGRRIWKTIKTLTENHRFGWGLLPALKVLLSCFISNFIKNFFWLETLITTR